MLTSVSFPTVANSFLYELTLFQNGGKRKMVELLPLMSQFALTLKALITTAADDIHKYFFIVFQGK